MLSTRKKFTWVQRLVLAISFAPFKQFYLGLYRAIIWYTARQLYRDRQVGAVYLRRGWVREEMVPGISDIDLVVILRDDAALSQAGASLALEDGYQRRYARLVHYLPLLDEFLLVYAADQLEAKYQTGQQDRYLLMEGRHNWRLLRGRNYLANLPALPEKMQQVTLLNRPEHRWFLFNRQFIHRTPADDPLALQSTCYRYCADMLVSMAGLDTHRPTLTRAQALEAALPRATGQDRAFIEQLAISKKRNFCGPMPNVIEATKRFMLAQFNSFYGDLRNHPLSRPVKEVPQHIDCLAHERFHTRAEEAHVRRLLDHVEQTWQDCGQGIYLVPSVYMDIDDLIFLIQIDAAALPTARQLTDLLNLHKEHMGTLARSIYLYLLLPNTACFLGVQTNRDRCLHFMLPQAFVFDLFQLVKRPEFALRPSPDKSWPPATFNAHAACYFWSQRQRSLRFLKACATKVEDEVEFLRQFWKYLQLVIVNHRVEAAPILYPLTLPAIERGLIKMGRPLPTPLGALAAAYHRAAAGQPLAIGEHIPAALAYLQALEPHVAPFAAPPYWLADASGREEEAAT